MPGAVTAHQGGGDGNFPQKEHHGLPSLSSHTAGPEFPSVLMDSSNRTKPPEQTTGKASHMWPQRPPSYQNRTKDFIGSSWVW